MGSLIFMYLAAAVLSGLVVVFVAYPYRRRPVPKAKRITDAVVSVAERVDPGEAPPSGVLTTPEKARRMSRRFELAELRIRRVARAVRGGRAGEAPFRR